MKTKPAPDPVADLEVTQDWSGPHVATDPRTEQSLPGGRLPASAAKKAARPPKRPWWQDRKALAAAGAAAFLLLLLGIWVIIRDKDGKEVARIQLPEGGSVTQEPIPTLPAPVLEKPEDRSTGAASEPQPLLSPWELPDEAPPPAIAPFDADTARRHQDSWAEYLGVPVEYENSIGMQFVLIPPGEFDMGSTEEEVAELLEEARATNQPSWYIGRLPSEAPRHRVRITKAFFLGMTEVTQAQYEQVMGANPSNFGGDPTRPVEMVSWEDAVEFRRKLSELQAERTAGRVYRLPTEAEWEYACRAGTTTRWYGTDDEVTLQEHAWFSANSGGTPHPVGQKRPNAWRLYDMHGNVWEWCQDWFDERYYASSPTDDPQGPSGGSQRVNRGGCWASDASYGRASGRGWHEPWLRHFYLGFRLLRTVP